VTTTLLERINALHAAGATDVTVSPDGSVTGKLPPSNTAERDLRERWAQWMRAEERRQREHAVAQRTAALGQSRGGIADNCFGWSAPK
jgi:hypothetical protein